MKKPLKKTAPLPRPVRLNHVARLIDRALERMLQPVEGAPRALHEAMRYCVASGGKRFRPLLCVGACEAVGGSCHDALAAACAIEMVHTYSLVHDDLPAMDDADRRRGRPSCHRRFGEGTAILVGDALLTRAFEVLGSNGTPNALLMLRTLGRAAGTAGLIGGQLLDLEKVEGGRRKAEGRRTEAGEWEEIARRKTGALIAASVEIGALAGHASAQERVLLQRFGRDVGLAFQLKDDVRDGDGVVPVLGAEEVARRANALLDCAVEAVTSFGSRAWRLQELAAWLKRS